MKQSEKLAKKCVICAILLVVGGLVLAFPLFSGAIGAAVGCAGILAAMIMGMLYRTLYRTCRTMALSVAAVITAAVGILLLLNCLWKFADMRFLVLPELVALGTITVALGLFLKEKTSTLWIYVLVAGSGAVAAGLCALWCVEAAFAFGCVVAAFSLFLPEIVRAVAKRKEDRANKIVTIREKDIEIRKDEDEKS